MALFIIADDSHRIGKMRGRGGYTDAVIPPRRKPVRVEDVDHIYHGSRKAARISDFANEDSDDISRRSHLKDRKLLDDITTKMVNSSYTEPVKVHRTAARRPPVVAPVTGRKPAKTTRRVGARPVPSLARTYRASSLPPQYVEEEVVTPYNLYEVVMPRSYYVYRPPPVKSAKVQYQSLNNIPQYQPKPRPISPVYRARARSEPPAMRSNTLAVKNARRCLDRIERELGVDDGELYAYPPPAPAVAREVRARTAVRGGGNAAAGRAAVRRRPGSLPPSSSRRGLNAINQAEIERYLLSGSSIAPKDYEQYAPLPNDPVPISFATLRSKTNEARNKCDLHKTLMDRYLPIYFGPENEVPYEVDYKYGELVDRMPSLDPYRPKQGSTGNNVGNNYGISSAGGYSGTAIAPYTPARVSKAAPVGSLPPKAPAFKPEMSDTRKRIRDVICMTRRDPHYYT